jgi:hypothetical protein
MKRIPATSRARRRLIATTIAAVCVLRPGAGSSSESNSLSAAVSCGKTNVYECEIVDACLTIRLLGERMAKELDLRWPVTEGLVVGAFREMPTTRRIENGRLDETRSFTFTAQARRPGPCLVSPTLRVTLLRRLPGIERTAWQEIPSEIPVAPLRLNVHPLPLEGRPANFSGAVGRFTLRAAISPAVVHVRDLVTVSTRIAGTGHLPEIPAPALGNVPGFKTYAPERVSGEPGNAAVFEQIVIPLATNAVNLPAISFSFFDPSAGTYETLTQGPFTIRVLSGPPAGSEESVRPPPRTYRARLLALLGTIRERISVNRVGAGLALGILVLALLAAVGRRRAAAWALSLAVLALGASASMLVMSRWDLFNVNESVVVAETVVRFAPAASAIATFEVPRGATVRVVSRSGGWAKIEWGDRRGWIPQANLRAH